MRLVALCVLTLPFTFSIGCFPKTELPIKTVPTLASDKAAVNGLFRDVASTAGLDFLQSNGAEGKFYFIESNPGGCAFLDYDSDGLIDVFLVQSGPVPGSEMKTPRPHCALFRNLGNGKFENVTAKAGLDFDQGYAQGVAVGDFDNDGNPDLFITGYGHCFLMHNDGKGHFQDITKQSGLSSLPDRWNSGAAFGDYDNDGKLDLVVLHYVHWTPQTDLSCYNASKQKRYCSPEVYLGETPSLYHNDGRGKFTDVTHASGLDKVSGRNLGVAWLDFDKDGREDLYISNDLKPNNLLRNLGGGKFKDVGLEAGAAYGPDGKALAGMGVAVGDFENSGAEGIVVTNFSGQPNSVFRSNGVGQFEEVSFPCGIGADSMYFLAFGVEFLDYDRDGWRDLIVGNGHIDPFVADSAPNVTYKEPKSIFHNVQGGKFANIREGLGDAAVPSVTRGLATGDFDNDGRVDVLTNNQNGPPQLLHNESKDKNHWISLRLEGVKSNRDGAGAKVWISAGKKRYYAECRLSSSYASSSDKRLFFGLGAAKKVDSIEIQWLGGAKQKALGVNLPSDAFYAMKEGNKPTLDSRVKK